MPRNAFRVGPNPWWLKSLVPNTTTKEKPPYVQYCESTHSFPPSSLDRRSTELIVPQEGGRVQGWESEC